MDASTRFATFLADKQLKMTRERRAILEEMLSVRGHLDADQLLMMFRRKGRPVSRATLYRTLARLVEAGLVHKIEMARGQARYEPMFGRHHHDHMVCIACGRIIEFESPGIERLQESVCRRKKFVMTGHTHQIRGRCESCVTGAAPPGDGPAGPPGAGRRVWRAGRLRAARRPAREPATPQGGRHV